jgi:pantoate--beta-alanine ligase
MGAERARRTGPAPWIRSPARVRALVRAWKRGGDKVAFVPTMGALHAGHLSLLRRAGRSADRVVASVFVNPLQFGPREDYKAYPRSRARDRALLAAGAADVVFAPEAAAFYPEGHVTRVSVGGVGETLEGEARPGHFAGVATVVTKLLNVVEPDVLWLGQKDAQQVAVLARMIEDLDLPVAVRVAPTVRERDGLAMSSRNARLAPAERAQAPALFAALQAGARVLVAAGTAWPRRIERAERAMARGLGSAPLARVDYARVVDPATFRRPGPGAARALLVVAARFPSARLIDNLPVRVKGAR